MPQDLEPSESAYIDFVNSFIATGALHRLRSDASPALEAVIVEPRRHAALEGVLHNFAHFLPNASFTVYHSDENADFVQEIASETNVKLVNFRAGNMGRDDYNDLLKSPDFWNARTAERTLIFQTDTGLLKNTIAKFWDYAFVGAPWTWSELGDPFYRVGNGGLSIRDTAFSAQLAAAQVPQPKSALPEDAKPKGTLLPEDAQPKGTLLPEDVLFSYAALYAGRSPSVKVAASFSMEWMDHPDPMGFHQAYRLHVHSQERRASLLQHFSPASLATPTPAPLHIVDAWIENSRDGRIYAVDMLKERLKVATGPGTLALPKKTRMWPDNIDGGAINAQPKKLVIQWKREAEPELMQTSCPLDPKLRVPIDISI